MKKKIALAATIIMAISFDAIAKEYFVAKNGNDENNGSSSAPFLTITKGVRALQAGDILTVRSGTYSESVHVARSGTAAKYITLRSASRGGAKIKPKGAHGILVQANYVVIDGFEVFGGRGGGIAADQSHHVEILNNISYGHRRAGISANLSEYIAIEGNVVYGNATSFVTSGISVHFAKNLTGNSSKSEFRIVIRNNVVYENQAVDTGHTDGNGIIIDDLLAHKNPNIAPYRFPILIENNVSYRNGGAGIRVFESENVTVRNNTVWGNNRDNKNKGTWRGELHNMRAHNNTWVNNVAVADTSVNPNNHAISNVSAKNTKNENIKWLNNITYDINKPGDESFIANQGNAKPTTASGNKLGVNPRLFNAPRDFRLQASSPAINAGTKAAGVSSSDINGKPRVVGGAVDMGAYEYN